MNDVYRTTQDINFEGTLIDKGTEFFFACQNFRGNRVFRPFQRIEGVPLIELEPAQWKLFRKVRSDSKTKPEFTGFEGIEKEEK